ncbi:MAG: WD40/YVTN/BNR-like repeat-containing protein [Tepidiformaceae bacterium]
MPQAHVLVGTRKAAFIYTSDKARQRWEVSEPLMRGSSIYSMTLDTRHDPPRLFAASNHWAWGRSAARSDDFGKTWEQRTPGLSFPADPPQPIPNMAFDERGQLIDRPLLTVENVWAITPGHESQPGVVWAGTQPAGLFRSEDWGESWTGIDSLNYREERKYWYPTGGGASSLHSIEVDPRDANHVYASIASGGTYVTSDGGETWKICSHNAIATTPEAREMIASFSNADTFPVPEGVDPAAADEFHKFRVDRKQPDRLWGQAHIGVFRSDDAGDKWHDVTAGLPSFHGFPLAVTKRQPDNVFVVPREFQADNFRVCPGQLAVYRSGDGGANWERLTKGLPGPNDYQSAYRDAMDTDGCDPEGVYLGTTNGQVYFGRDGGEHWERLPGTLPPILSVTAIEVP